MDNLHRRWYITKLVQGIYLFVYKNPNAVVY